MHDKFNHETSHYRSVYQPQALPAIAGLVTSMKTISFDWWKNQLIILILMGMMNTMFVFHVIKASNIWILTAKTWVKYLFTLTSVAHFLLLLIVDIDTLLYILTIGVDIYGYTFSEAKVQALLETQCPEAHIQRFWSGSGTGRYHLQTITLRARNSIWVIHPIYSLSEWSEWKSD